MLESVISNRVESIEPSFKNNKDCDVNFKFSTWFKTNNFVRLKNSSGVIYRTNSPQAITSSTDNRQFRKRFSQSTFETERLWKRKREYKDDESDFTYYSQNQSRILKSEILRNCEDIDKMTKRNSCQPRRRNESRYFNNRSEYSNSHCQRNRSFSNTNGTYFSRNQSHITDRGFDRQRHIRSKGRHKNQNNLQSFAESNNQNLHYNAHSARLAETASPLIYNNPYPLLSDNSPALRRFQQSLEPATSLYPLLNPMSSPSRSNIPNTPNQATPSSPPSPPPPPLLSSSSSSNIPIVTPSFCHNTNQLRFAAYPIGQYPSTPPHTPFPRTPVTTTAILPSASSAFYSTVPTSNNAIPTSSTRCLQCAAIIASTMPNPMPMLQFSVASTATSVISLAAISADRIIGPRFNYVPIPTYSHWNTHNPYLPAAWSYNDLSSIINHSTPRHILQEHFTQRLLTTANVGIQLVMMSPTSVLSSNDLSNMRHHFIPVNRTTPMSPMAVARFLPIPSIDPPKIGITKHELDQIPVKKFVKSDLGNATKDDDKEKCMICLEDFVTDEIIRMLKCSHDFHSPCVERWLKINRTCPLCRADTVALCNRRMTSFGH